MAGSRYARTIQMGHATGPDAYRMRSECHYHATSHARVYTRFDYYVVEIFQARHVFDVDRLCDQAEWLEHHAAR